MNRALLLLASAAALSGGGVAYAAPAAGPTGVAKATLKIDPTALDMEHLRKMGMGYMPIAIEFKAEKPTGVKKEPAYRGIPKYATIRLGNGPRASFIAVLDEPDASDSRIFVDVNQNGDLTDDGDGSWGEKSERDGRVSYGVKPFTLRASWGTQTRETSSAPYVIEAYHFGGNDRAFYRRVSARAGTLNLAGKTLPVLLAENDGDALFNKPLDDDGKPVNGGPDTRPVWLIIEGRSYDIRGPFVFNHTNYEATATPDGSVLTVRPTTRAVIAPRPAAPTRQLTASGAAAPDFTVVKPDNTQVKLSDYKGKVVVLDFWATWCGPCQASMPHLQRVYEAAKGKNVVVLGVCVSDERAAFDKWVTANATKYTFPVFYDPAGRSENSISGKLYGVTGIPTTFVIGADGKVAGSIVGFSGADDDRLEKQLASLGVQVERTASVQ